MAIVTGAGSGIGAAIDAVAAFHFLAHKGKIHHLKYLAQGVFGADTLVQIHTIIEKILLGSVLSHHNENRITKLTDVSSFK